MRYFWSAAFGHQQRIDPIRRSIAVQITDARPIHRFLSAPARLEIARQLNAAAAAAAAACEKAPPSEPSRHVR